METICPCSECCYDYIVVGAGCGGSVVAARLAEDPNVRVLLLEGGHNNIPMPENYEINEYQKKLMSVPSLMFALFPRYHINPTLIGCGAKNKGVAESLIEASPTHLEFTTVKEYKRYYTYPRGNGAGGSTNHHNLIDGRGSHLPYERIAKEMDDPRWSYQNILKYYKKMETYHVDEADPEYHGDNGWLHIKHTGLENELTENLVSTMTEDLGVPFVGDLNIPGQYSGVGYNDTQVNPRGRRSNAFLDLLYPMIQKQEGNQNKNLFIKFNSLVSKVLIDDRNGDLKAYGVEVYQNPHLYKVDTTGNKVIDIEGECKALLPDRSKFDIIKYYATKEVILCGGSFNTPQILMLSGLGPKENLTKLGIEVKKDMPGVGQNLMDHHEFTISYQIDPKKFMWRWQATYLSQDINKTDDKEIIASIKKYRDPSSYNDNDVHLIMDWHSGLDEINMEEPDLHFQVVNHLFFDFNLNFITVEGDNLNAEETKKDSTSPNPLAPTNSLGVPKVKEIFFASQFDIKHPKVFLSFLIENLKINSWTGSVTLRSADPRDPPIIELGLWKDNVTLERLARAVLITRRIMQSPKMMQFCSDPNDYSKFEVLPGTHADTIEKIMEYLRTWSCIGHHVAGTAKMGRSDDPMAVVDSSLRVRGVNGLRIVDASVYPPPNLHAYNPTRGIYMIAEMVSDMIKEEYRQYSNDNFV
ncbi:putative oxireductase [Tupanvirus deep ocean]|uniref:Oxireductase n=2 Tax=Tupanvirus TaxID=2094720 RepID=A0AC62A739_9VIRU|nr:putative oxireductase [Tupanvirus deep ocean]QKU33546.1 putative oxireductase [Tupanvirus deep ocean]